MVDLCVPSHLHARLGVEAARAGKHVIVEKPLTGFFGDPATPRPEMLRQALAAADAGHGVPQAGVPALLRGELGLRAALAEGAAAPGRLRRPHPAARRRGEPFRHPRADQQALGDGRRAGRSSGRPATHSAAPSTSRRTRAVAGAARRSARSRSWPRSRSSPTPRRSGRAPRAISTPSTAPTSRTGVAC